MSQNLDCKLTYITSGAAGMYCGSCMHDNSLANALSAAGVDTTLVSTYTPIRTDEQDTTVDQVFFGGINVYLQQKIPMFRRLPRMLDRFLDRPWLIRQVTSRAIETDGKLLGSLAVSMLKGTAGNQYKEVKRLVTWLRDTAKPDLVILSNILIGGFIKFLKSDLGIPVVVTLQGDDIFLKSLSDPYKSQAINLISEFDKTIDAYLVHSNFYADFMADYLSLDRTKMHVTPLGINTADFESIEPRESKNVPLKIGYMARLSEDKGLHVLTDAFIELNKDRDLPPLELLIAGWLGSDHHRFANQQFKKLDDAGLADGYQYLGSVDREQKTSMLKSLDILSVPTIYQEPKGLYVLEALACGVPVVQPSHGAFPEMLDDLGGGCLFEPNHPSQLVQELKRLLLDPDLRLKLGQQGRKAVLENRDAETMARETIKVIQATI